MISFTLDDYFSCDIESDARNNQQCRIRQDTNDNFDWTRMSSMTPSGLSHKRRINGRQYPVTGPEYAMSGSYYLYAEASGRGQQQVARQGYLCLQLNDEYSKTVSMFPYKCIPINLMVGPKSEGRPFPE